MNSSSKDNVKGDQETQAFDPLPIHQEEVEHPMLDDDEKEGAEKSETAQVKEDKEDKEESEIVAKEAMLRVTGGQL
jgi:hypothetical protein